MRLSDGTRQTYYYHRASRIRLPDDPASAAFAAKLEELKRPRPVRAAKAEHTIGGMIVAYKGAPDFQQLALSMQRDYRRYLDMVDDYGDMPIKLVRR